MLGLVSSSISHSGSCCLLHISYPDSSYHIKGKIYRACCQSVFNVLTYGTETWAVKVENLHSLMRTEGMMVRWMCGVLLKDQNRFVQSFGYTECDRCG